MLYFILGMLTMLIISVIGHFILKTGSKDGYIYIDVGDNPPKAYMQLVMGISDILQRKYITLQVDKINSHK